MFTGSAHASRWRAMLACLAASLTVISASACARNTNPQSPDATGGSPASVVASFGKIENFVSFEKTESTLGWRVLRADDPKYAMGRNGGILRTLPNVNLPRLEQAYSLEGHGDTAIIIVQEPEAYGNLGSIGREEVIGSWSVKFSHGSGGTGVHFYSGEMANARRVIVHVTAGPEYSEDEVRRFVKSLAFGR